MKRRDFLLAASGASGGVSAAGGAAAQQTTPGGETTAGPGGTATTNDGTAGNGTATTTGGNATSTPGGGGGGGTTHTVDMTDSLVFDPAEITIAPGDTVEWVNVGGVGHSVTAYEDDLPEGAEYFASGGFDSESAARSAYTAGDPSSGDIAGGESYAHTFQTTGQFPYFCIPHESVGMDGTVIVQEGGAQTGGGAEPADPEDMGVPFQAQWVGAATLLMMVVSLIYSFFVLKYGESPHASAPED